MIFIINETKNKITLNATQTEENGTVLNVSVNDGTNTVSTPIASTLHKELRTVIMEKFGTPVELEKKLSKHNFKVENARVLIDNEETEIPRLLAIEPADLELFKVKLAKNIIVVISSAKDVVVMDDSNLYRKPNESVLESVKVTNFIIKWPNWSNLKHPVNITINGANKYRLGKLESKFEKGVFYNAIIKLSPSSKTPNTNKTNKRTNKPTK